MEATETSSSTTCYGRFYQSPGSSVAPHLPHFLGLALSTDYIASGVDSDRRGAYVTLTIADSVASGIDSDRGGAYASLITADSLASDIDPDRGVGNKNLTVILKTATNS